MSIEEFATKHLTDNGLWPQEAATVIGVTKEAMKDSIDGGRRWRDDRGLPEALLGGVDADTQPPGCRIH